jgi:hypothetical protein
VLEPDSRAILLDELRPPDGFRLDAAVATTFTLSLVAALVPPLAFASEQLQGNSDPISALEAIRSSGDRIDIFCQVGQIGVPTNAPSLVAFLEPMVHEVKAPRAGFLFHPKMWVLRFVDGEGVTRHRLVVLTRNLTNDSTWDVTVRLDGQLLGGPKAANKPLADLVRALPDLVVHGALPAARRARVLALAEEVRRIEWENPADVQFEAFHVFGIPSVKATPDFSGYKHLVISPFITDEGLELVTCGGSPDVTVVSRARDLDLLSTESATGIRSFQLTGSANLDDEESGEPEQLAGLHAKIYVAERNRRAFIFIGSANATGPAMSGNVEILVELSGGATKVGVDTIVGPGAPLRPMLDEYQAAGGATETDRDKAQRELEQVVRSIAEINHVVTVSDGSAPYELHAATGKRIPLPEGYLASLRVLTIPSRAHHVKEASAGPIRATFSDAALEDISPFLVWEVTSPASIPSQSTVVRAELRNEPAGRLDEILARQIDTPEKFFRFLALLLGLADGLEPGNDNGDTGAGAGIFGANGSGIFEVVVRALADRPANITDLDSLIIRMEASEQGRAIAGEDFLALWQMVREAVGIRSGTRHE